jgi:3-deoxy-D-manno-octulosonate 8-phosphate phosphatase (KDO 8-P phosphatase)
VGLSGQEIDARAARLRLLLFDVDGVLTDGTIFIRGDGAERKGFHIRDGAAIVWAQREGLKVGLLSGRPSVATTRRAAELGISMVSQDPDKSAAYSKLLLAEGLTDDQVAYMGDDLIDLAVLGRVGLSSAPADAAQEVLTRVHWVSRQAGGRGAVRELVELVLRAQGRWETLVGGFRE